VEVPSRPVSDRPALSRAGTLARSLAPLAAVILAASVIIAAQPVTSPWWIYADADGTYSASALNIMAKGHSRYFDHPGLPEQEALAATFAVASLAHGGPTRAFASSEMLHLDRARWVFRGWAIFFFIGGAALAYLLCRRLFGHWTWGLAGGLLWLAMPGIEDTIQIRPDVLLSALVLLTGYVTIRAWERRSAALYAVAAAITGFAVMTKLHAVALLPALVLATVIAHPPAGWWPRLLTEARSFVSRHRISLGAAVAAWLALFIFLNRGRFRISVNNVHLTLLIAIGVVVVGYAAATWAAEGRGRVGRIFDPLYVLLAGAFAFGMIVPLSLVLSDSPRVLVGTVETLLGRNINAGVTPFQIPSSQFGKYPLLEVMILIGVAAVAAVVGIRRRTAWPVLWFTAAGVATLFAAMRLGEARYFAPGFVLAIPAALWLFRRRASAAASPLVWVLVAIVVVPTFLHMNGPAHAARTQEREDHAATLLADQLLRPGQVALVSTYADPEPDARWWGLVEDFITTSPAYPYRFLPAQPQALTTAADQHLRVGYYIGNLALGITKKEQLTLGSGTYRAAPVPGGQRFAALGVAAVKLLSGPGT
jgi:Dolichyl-phosphate-mannose-protein mannosyltransferase